MVHVTSDMKAAYTLALAAARTELAPYMTSEQVKEHLWWQPGIINRKAHYLSGIAKRYLTDPVFKPNNYANWCKNIVFTAAAVHGGFNPKSICTTPDLQFKYKFVKPNDGKKLDALAKLLWPELSLKDLAAKVYEEAPQMLMDDGSSTAFIDKLWFFLYMVAFTASAFELTRPSHIAKMASKINHCAQKGSFTHLTDRGKNSLSTGESGRRYGNVYDNYAAIKSGISKLADILDVDLEDIHRELKTGIRDVGNDNAGDEAASNGSDLDDEVSVGEALPPSGSSGKKAWVHKYMSVDGELYINLLVLLVSQATSLSTKYGMGKVLVGYFERYLGNPNFKVKQRTAAKRTRKIVTQAELQAIAEILCEARTDASGISDSEIRAQLVARGFPERTKGSLYYIVRTRYVTELERLQAAIEADA